MEGVKVRSRGRLPHWEREGGTYFVTFRLVDSLPRSLLESIEFERRDIFERARQQGRELTSVELGRLDQIFSEKIDTYLDSGQGACYLARPEVADLVAGALRYFDGQRYDLDSCCVMPNHVHALFMPIAGQRLADILECWKSFTARRGNAILGRKGHLWQREYYDRLVRNAAEMQRFRRYIAENPARANLPGWKWVWTKK